MATELPQDTALLACIQDGDSSAFATLVKKHHETFYRLAYRYMQNRSEAEDMVQTAFLKLWEYPDKWNPDKGIKFTTWFYRLVVNLCLDHHKKKKPMPLMEGYEVEDAQQNQEAWMLQKEQRKQVEVMIAKLPERQRTALILCFDEGLSNQEAADAMKLSKRAVRSLLMRAKDNLKKQVY